VKSLVSANFQADNQGGTLPRKIGFFLMVETKTQRVTHLMQAAQAGDQSAAARLLPLVYAELRKLAHARMKHQRPGQTLEPTALVHEAYLRLVGKTALPIESRKHFFFAAARAMRDILVERARSKAGLKRGGGRKRVELSDGLALSEPPPVEVLALHEVLDELEHLDPLKAQIVQLRYFTGMDMSEIAQVLGLSERTVHRHWRFLKAWLKSRLDG
jgi:RNA polymerase sigma factor (TIGR02999 family)